MSLLRGRAAGGGALQGPRVAASAAASLLAAAVTSVSAAAEGPRVVTREEILVAMRRSEGYALTATANGPRLQAEVLLHLLRLTAASDPSRRPLLLGHEEWYLAFLERTGLEPDEVPVYVRLPYLIGQDLVVDFRWERVVETVVRGPKPRRVANVRLHWPRAARQESFSYDDLHSDPTLRVTLEQDIHYRLVDYGDQLWYTEVAGVHGRPTSGALGLLFDLIGEARVLETRSAMSADGLQIVRSRGRKLFLTRTATATIWPDGHARKGIPEGRPDLLAIEERLMEPREIRFVPLEQGS